jgi:hypothetical protein
VARPARAAVWIAASAATLVGGALALAWLAFRVHPAGPAAAVQSAAARALFAALVRQALLPELAIAAGLWLALARRVPRLDASWRTLLPGLAAASALAFPPVGLWCFRMWTPAGPGDVAATWALLAAGTTLALGLPRALFRGLRPGAFGPRDAPVSSPHG